MTNEQIDEAIAKCEARTPGKWDVTGWSASPDDTAYIAATTDPETGYEAALREVQRLRAELAELREAARGKEKT